MLIDERHKKIIEILQKEKIISTKKLAKLLFFSEATLRRDLIKMEQKGILQRTRGGASILESFANESSILIREQKQIQEKRRIALKCFELLKDNTSFFVDSSSTVGSLLYYFQNFENITVITNSLNNCSILTKTTKAAVYLTPGLVDQKTNSLLGSDTIEYIKNFYCNVFLFSCSGLSLHGISEANSEQSLIKREMLKHSKTHILLVDHTKFNKNYLSLSYGFEDIDYIITDKLPDSAYIKLFQENKTKLIIA
ncbi:MAG: DeoR/GlpR family DNA-binding transcription regulator [Bacilli bacterium]|jgi:DeoR/GlpR family transcriptional regulator of sugar metabolism